MSIYDFSVTSITGEEKKLESFRGQALLIVNVASACGFTPQYEGLEKLYEKYKDKGFSVLGFPCNQFGGQESGSNEEIQTFCDTRFHVSFPMFSKIEVNGPHTHPLYEYLKKEEKGILGTEAIKWNFTKFLVDKKGNILKRYAPQTTPEAIEKELAALI